MIGDIIEGEGCVWMALPDDPSTTVRTPIREGETPRDAAVRMVTALGLLLSKSLMSTVDSSTTTSTSELAEARRVARASRR